jgi:hypothetical protein
MATNTYKDTPKAKGQKPEAFSLFRRIENYIKVDGLFEKGVPVIFLPKIMFITLLVIFYIANSHYTDKTVRKIDKIKLEVENLRADYTTQKYEYMKESMQSEVAKKVAAIGLEESSVPPFKIVLKESEY